MFRSLSHFHRVEDGEVRGDLNEGSISFRPEGGLIIHNKTQGKTSTVSEGTFGSGINTEEVFILCGSNSMTDEMRIRFDSKACVQILRIATLCARIQHELPPTATFRAQRVTYYSPANEPGAGWAFPGMIAFSKLERYAWQDGSRLVFSLTDALQYGNTAQQVKIPGPLPGIPQIPISTVSREYHLTVKALGDICKLHIL
jgi:hypothetical protein